MRELAALAPELGPVLLVGRAVLGDQAPERGGVVRVPGVAELVEEDVVYHRLLEEEESGVERDHPLLGTAAPARPRQADRAPFEGETVGRAERCKPREEVGSALAQ